MNELRDWSLGLLKVTISRSAGSFATRVCINGIDTG